MAVYSYVWLSRAMYGYVGLLRLCVAMYGYVWPCRAL